MLCCFITSRQGWFFIGENMEKERNIGIAEAYSRIVKPWTFLGLEPPSVSVKQIAREAGVPNPTTIAGELVRGEIIFGVNGNLGRRLTLEDVGGNQVEDLESAAREAAPYKRAVREADYRSRAPGGGPVVKRRVNENSLERKLIQLGKGRLKVGVKDYDEEGEREKKRQDTKRRLEMRWAGKSPVESNPITSRIESSLSFIKKVSERRGVANEAEISNRLKTNIELGCPQTILAIWGPPYEGQGNQNVFDSKSPEEKMARSIIDVVNQLSTIIETRLLILYADYYGTGVNNIPRDEVENYGQQIKRRFEGAGEFISWSQLKKENSIEYESLRDSLPEAVIEPDEDEIRRAIIMQDKLGYTVTDEQATELAIAYKRERIVEGIMLKEGFFCRGNLYNNIIKLGTAPSRTNDEPYEPELPRFYVSGMPRAAWNTAR